MSDLVDRFSRFAALPRMRTVQVQNTILAVLEALNSGLGSLELAFELDLMAARVHPESPDHKLLLETADDLRASAFATTGAGYLAKGSLYLRH